MENKSAVGYTVERILDSGMKICTFRDTEITLRFCDDTTDQEMELVCLRNKAGQKMLISIEGTPLKYGVGRGGRFYFVGCNGAFVQTFPMICCEYDSNHESDVAIIRTGSMYYRFRKDESISCKDDFCQISYGPLGIDYDGTVWINGYRIILSDHGYPIVYSQNGRAIDSKGHLFIPQGEYRYNKVFEQLIASSKNNYLRITSKRELRTDYMQVLENCGLAFQIEDYGRGMLVLMKSGDAFYGWNSNWKKICEQCTAIAVYGNYFAVSVLDGTVRIYDGDANPVECIAEMHFPDRHISEMAFSKTHLVTKFADCSFRIVNWHTGKPGIKK